MTCMNSAAGGRCETRHFLPQSGPADSRVAARRLRVLARMVLGWIERSRQRQYLRELDAHLLKDIGVSPGDARAEAEKPFWRA